MPNAFIQQVRQQLPDDPRTDDELTMLAAELRPELADQFPDFKADVDRIVRSQFIPMGSVETGLRNLGRGVTSMLASVPESIAVGGKGLADIAEKTTGSKWARLGEPETVQQMPLYQAGQSVQNWVAPAQPVPEDQPWRKFFLESVPQGIGSSVGFIAAGTAGKLLKLPVLLSTAGMGVMANGVQGWEDAKAHGADDSTAFKSFLLNGGFGVSEAAPIADLFGSLNRFTGGGFTKAFIHAIKEGGRQTFEEAVQEASQQVAGNFVANGMLDYDKSRSLWEGVAPSAGAGGISGFVLGTLFGAIGAKLHGVKGTEAKGAEGKEGTTAWNFTEPLMGGTDSLTVEDKTEVIDLLTALRTGRPLNIDQSILRNDIIKGEGDDAQRQLFFMQMFNQNRTLFPNTTDYQELLTKGVKNATRERAKSEGGEQQHQRVDEQLAAQAQNRQVTPAEKGQGAENGNRNSPGQGGVVEQAVANKADELPEAFQAMGRGISDSFYAQGFASLQNGSTVIAGINDPVLIRAKPFYDQGLIRSPEDLKTFVQNGYKIDLPTPTPTPESPAVVKTSPAVATGFNFDADGTWRKWNPESGYSYEYRIEPIVKSGQTTYYTVIRNLKNDEVNHGTGNSPEESFREATQERVNALCLFGEQLFNKSKPNVVTNPNFTQTPTPEPNAAAAPSPTAAATTPTESPVRVIEPLKPEPGEVPTVEPTKPTTPGKWWETLEKDLYLSPERGTKATEKVKASSARSVEVFTDAAGNDRFRIEYIDSQGKLRQGFDDDPIWATHPNFKGRARPVPSGWIGVEPRTTAETIPMVANPYAGLSARLMGFGTTPMDTFIANALNQRKRPKPTVNPITQSVAQSDIYQKPQPFGVTPIDKVISYKNTLIELMKKSKKELKGSLGTAIKGWEVITRYFSQSGVGSENYLTVLDYLQWQLKITRPEAFNVLRDLKSVNALDLSPFQETKLVRLIVPFRPANKTVSVTNETPITPQPAPVESVPTGGATTTATPENPTAATPPATQGQTTQQATPETILGMIDFAPKRTKGVEETTPRGFVEDAKDWVKEVFTDVRKDNKNRKLTGKLIAMQDADGNVVIANAMKGQAKVDGKNKWIKNLVVWPNEKGEIEYEELLKQGYLPVGAIILKEKTQGFHAVLSDDQWVQLADEARLKVGEEMGGGLATASSQQAVDLKRQSNVTVVDQPIAPKPLRGFNISPEQSGGLYALITEKGNLNLNDTQTAREIISAAIGNLPNFVQGAINAYGINQAANIFLELTDHIYESFKAAAEGIENGTLDPVQVQSAIRSGIEGFQATVAEPGSSEENAATDTNSGEEDELAAADTRHTYSGSAGVYSNAQEINAVQEVRDAQGRLLAPNGKPSNLNPTQWKQVRTPSFIRWFGDWINDPKNASKVVDENGEPMLMFHGTDSKSGFSVFKTGRGIYGEAISTSPSPETARQFGSAIYPVFLNVRNPASQELEQAMADSYEQMTSPPAWGQYDGVIAIGGMKDSRTGTFDGEIAVKSPTQIKSAISNTGAFSASNPDIRYTQSYSDTQEVNDQFDRLKDNLTTGGVAVQVVEGMANEGTYHRNVITMTMVDADAPTIENFGQLLHEAAHHVDLGIDPAIRNAVHAAIDGLTNEQLGIEQSTDPRVQFMGNRARIIAFLRAQGLTQEQAEARVAEPYNLTEERLAESLRKQGIESGLSNSFAAQIIRIIKDLFYQVAMRLQQAIGRIPSKGLALGFVRNRFNALISGQAMGQNLFGYVIMPPTRAQQVTNHAPDDAVGWMAERLDTETGRMTYGETVDMPLEDEFELRHTYSYNDISSESAKMHASENVAIANEGLAINGQAIQSVSTHPAVMAYVGAGGDTGQWFNSMFALAGFGKQKQAALSFTDPITKAPVQINPDARIQTDQFNDNKQVELAVRLHHKLTAILSRISKRTGEAEIEADRLTAQYNNRAPGLQESIRDWDNTKRLSNEVYRGVKALLGEIVKTGGMTQIREGRPILSNLRALAQGTEVTSAQYQGALFDFLNNRGLEEYTFNMLSNLADNPAIDFQGPITAVRDALLALNIPEFNSLTGNDAASMARLAAVYTYAHTHEWMMVRLEMRKLGRTDEELGARGQIVKKLLEMWQNPNLLRSPVSEAQAIGKAAKLLERARLALRMEVQEVKKLQDRAQKQRAIAEAGKLAMPVYAQAINQWAGIAGIHSKATYGEGMTITLPSLTAEGEQFEHKTLHVNAFNNPTNPQEVEAWRAQQKEWLDMRRATGILDGRYLEIKAQYDELGKVRFTSGVVDTIHRQCLYWLKELTENFRSIGTVASRQIVQMLKRFDIESYRLKREAVPLWRDVEGLTKEAMAIIDPKLRNAGSFKTLFYNPIINFLEKSSAISNDPNLSEEAKWDLAFEQYEQRLRNLSPHDPRKKMIAGKEGAMTQALRRLAEANERFDKWAIKNNIEEVVYGKESVRTRITRGLITLPRHASAEFEAMHTALAKRNWAMVGDETADPFKAIPELYKNDPGAARQALAPFFSDDTIWRLFVGEQAYNVDGTPFPGIEVVVGINDETGEPITEMLPVDPNNVQLAYDAAQPGDIVTMAETLFNLETADQARTPAYGKEQYLGRVLESLTGVWKHVHNSYNLAHQIQTGTYSGVANMMPGFQVYGRVNESWPEAWFDPILFDRHAAARSVEKMAAQIAYGLEHGRLAKALETVKSEVEEDLKNLGELETHLRTHGADSNTSVLRKNRLALLNGPSLGA